MNTDLHFSSKTAEWATPKELFDALDREFKFTLDPCCTHENAKCEKHYTREEDGLSQDWTGERVFVNPPYGRVLADWVKKCYNEWYINCATVVMLIPARTDTKYFHRYIYNQPGVEIRFLRGRIKFVGEDGSSENSAPFPSMIVIFGGSK